MRRRSSSPAIAYAQRLLPSLLPPPPVPVAGGVLGFLALPVSVARVGIIAFYGREGVLVPRGRRKLWIWGLVVYIAAIGLVCWAALTSSSVVVALLFGWLVAVAILASLLSYVQWRRAASQQGDGGPAPKSRSTYGVVHSVAFVVETVQLSSLAFSAHGDRSAFRYLSFGFADGTVADVLLWLAAAAFVAWSVLLVRAAMDARPSEGEQSDGGEDEGHAPYGESEAVDSWGELDGSSTPTTCAFAVQVLDALWLPSTIALLRAAVCNLDGGSLRGDAGYSCKGSAPAVAAAASLGIATAQLQHASFLPLLLSADVEQPGQGRRLFSSPRAIARHRALIAARTASRGYHVADRALKFCVSAVCVAAEGQLVASFLSTLGLGTGLLVAFAKAPARFDNGPYSDFRRNKALLIQLCMLVGAAVGAGVSTIFGSNLWVQFLCLFTGWGVAFAFWHTKLDSEECPDTADESSSPSSVVQESRADERRAPLTPSVGRLEQLSFYEEEEEVEPAGIPSQRTPVTVPAAAVDGGADGGVHKNPLNQPMSPLPNGKGGSPPAPNQGVLSPLPPSHPSDEGAMELATDPTLADTPVSSSRHSRAGADAVPKVVSVPPVAVVVACTDTEDCTQSLGTSGSFGVADDGVASSDEPVSPTMAFSAAGSFRRPSGPDQTPVRAATDPTAAQHGFSPAAASPGDVQTQPHTSPPEQPTAAAAAAPSPGPAALAPAAVAVLPAVAALAAARSPSAEQQLHQIAEEEAHGRELVAAAWSAALPELGSGGAEQPQAQVRSGSHTDYWNAVEDEEDESEYRPGGYHRVAPGDLLAGRQRAACKLGWGQFSTVWMVRDERTGDLSAVKISKAAPGFRQASQYEIDFLQEINAAREGRVKSVDTSKRAYADQLVRMTDFFELEGPHGLHLCICLEVMGPNLLRLISNHNFEGIDPKIVKAVTKHILRGLTFLSALGMMHTDLKPENILLCAQDPGVLNAARASLGSEGPCDPRDLESAKAVLHGKYEKPTGGETLQAALERQYHVKISDFGAARWARRKHPVSTIQTREYRAPEVILGQEQYTCAVDTWSVPCIVFELLTGDFLFDPKAQEEHDKDTYHLMLFQRVLGALPPAMTTGPQAGEYAGTYFRRKGSWSGPAIRDRQSLDDMLRRNYGMSRGAASQLAGFLLPMLRYDPAQRISPKRALSDQWLTIR